MAGEVIAGEVIAVDVIAVDVIAAVKINNSQESIVKKSLNHRVKILSLVALFAILVAACAPVATTGTGAAAPAAGSDTTSAESAPAALTEEEKFGGTAVIRIAGEPQGLNTLLAGDAIAGAIDQVLNEPLIRRNLEGDYVGRLVESWSTSEDGLTWTFKLRDGLKWHDGEPLTADDVVFSYNLIANEESGLSSDRGALVVNGELLVYEKVDDLTFNIVTPAPYAPLLSTLIQVIPEHYWKDVPPAEFATSPLNNAPIGAGPFKFVEYKPGEYLSFERFDEYWEGQPYLEGIIYRIIPDNAAALVALESGQVHFTDVATNAFDEVKAKGQFETAQNFSGNVQFLSLNNQVAPFDDVLVRKAIHHLTNKDALAQQVLLGYAQRADNFLVPGDLFYNEDAVVKYDYDVEKAKDLLAEAGWTPGANGILEKDGTPLEFEVTVQQGNLQREQAAVLLQASFAEAGIKLNIRSLEWSALVALLDATADGSPRNYQSLIIGNTLGPEPSRYRVVYDDYYPGYVSEEVNALFDIADVTTDVAQRQAYYEEIQTKITDDSPVVWLWYAQTLYAFAPQLGIEDAELTGLAHWRFLNFSKLYLRP